MGVIDDIQAARQFLGPECRLRLFLESIPAEDADEYRRLIWSPTYTHVTLAAIARHIRARGEDLAAEALGRHRRLECHRCAADAAVYRDTK